MIRDIIKKDLKIILRSKVSTTAILLAPVLIILLVGIAFSQSGTLQLNVGLVNSDSAPTYSEKLAARFSTYSFDSEQECEVFVQKGILHACVVFSNDSATILLDPSNMQLVAQIESSVSEELEEQASEEGLFSADQVLSGVVKSRYKLDQDVALSTAIASQASELKKTLQAKPSDITIDSAVFEQSTTILQNVIKEKEWVRDLGKKTVDEYANYIEAHETEPDKKDSLLKQLEERRDRLAQDSTIQTYKQFETTVSSTKKSLDDANNIYDELRVQTLAAQNLATKLEQDTVAIQASLQENTKQLGTIRIKDKNIVSPMVIDIKAVTKEKQNFSFVFQFFFVLIIMFSAILLASSIVVRERSSRAYFRNFSSPTPDYLFALGTFISVLLIILFQTIILYLASILLSDVNLLANIGTTLIIIILVASICTLIGMAIGYLLRTQEAAIVGSITVTSIFLLLSPLILPLETLPGMFRFLGTANPFVIGAELLKNSVLFHFSIFQMPKAFVLVLYSGILAGGIFVVQRATKFWIIERKATTETIADFVAELDIPPEKYLYLGSRTIRNKEQLLQALRLMDDQEFEEYANPNRNIIADWIADVYKNYKLADTLRNKNRAGHSHYLQKK